MTIRNRGLERLDERAYVGRFETKRATVYAHPSIARIRNSCILGIPRQALAVQNEVHEGSFVALGNTQPLVKSGNFLRIPVGPHVVQCLTRLRIRSWYIPDEVRNGTS